MALSNSDISDQYQKVLGRQPTQSEILDMQRFGNTGYVDLSANDIGTILQKTPEYQQSQLNTQGQQFSNQLGQSDSRMLGLAQNQITQNFAQQGRTMSSSAYVNAFAGAAQNLAMQRQQTMANFYGQGYQNIQQNTMQQGNDTYGMGVNSLAQNKNFQNSLQMYHMQQNDFNNYLNSQNRTARNGALGGAILGTAGAIGGGILGAAGGPAGIAAGGMIGGQLGGNIGSSFGRGLGG